MSTGANVLETPYLNEGFACFMVCSMASLEKRKHTVKFDPMELEVLVDEANKHLNELQQRNLTVGQRNAIWEEICEEVNAVGKMMRTVDELKRRYQDIRRRTKEKLAYNKTSANKTGGGRVGVMPLTSIKERVHLTFCEEQVTGIAGYDTLDQTAEQESSLEVQPFPSNPPQEQLELLQGQKTQSAALQTDGQRCICPDDGRQFSGKRATGRDAGNDCPQSRWRSGPTKSHSNS